MKLVRFSCTTGLWVLAEFNLQPINLLVGKNAVGKSKTIESIYDVVSYILQQKELEQYFACVLLFEDGTEHISYSFEYTGDKIVKEELAVSDEVGNINLLLDRQNGKTLLHGEMINPPQNKLTLHVRRDTVQYPYIEKIVSWAEHVCGQRFNEIDLGGDGNKFSYMSQRDDNLFEMVKAMPEEVLRHVIEQANALEYPLEKIVPYENGDIKKLFFYEIDVPRALLDFQLSKGMFRTLHLLIYMEYLAYRNNPSLLLIDDVCEGLDYARSTKLGKLLFEFCLQHNIQLIASSNDSFLMDVVDLKYWNILERDGSVVNSINIENNRELFESFGFTGLSNFDFFSSDYIARHAVKRVGDE